MMNKLAKRLKLVKWEKGTSKDVKGDERVDTNNFLAFSILWKIRDYFIIREDKINILKYSISHIDIKLNKSVVVIPNSHYSPSLK